MFTNIFKGLVPVIAFLLGCSFMWLVNEKYNDSIMELWTQGYEFGRTDGRSEGLREKQISEFSFEEREAHCLFLYSDRKR